MKRVDENFEYMSFKTTGLEMVACCFERNRCFQDSFYIKGHGEALYVLRIEIHKDKSNYTIGLSKETYIDSLREI